jgi:hypothetical protein
MSSLRSCGPLAIDDHGYVMESVDKTFFTLKHGMTFYLFKFMWMILSLVVLLMCLCQVFRK